MKDSESNVDDLKSIVKKFCDDGNWDQFHGGKELAVALIIEAGELVEDVKIGNFSLPWETHGKIKPPEGYVKWYEWAYKPEGIKQVGCIYTAQGFEFDYIGVIVGPDLKYHKEKDCLVGNREGTKDPILKRGKERFDEYVKNIYRVLMSRGMKGCYVYFVDKEVEKYFRSRIQGDELEAEAKKGEIKLK